MKKMISCLAALTVFLAASAFAQTSVFWNGLEKGPYDAGFAVDRVLDHSRPFQKHLDEQGRPLAERGRPIQMFIWYPAQPAAPAAPLRYEDYLYLNDVEAVPWQWSETGKQAILQKYTEELEIYKGNLQPLLSSQTAAIKDANIAPGKFPIVIFGAGGGTGGHVYSVLCEYLATHGYVVIAHTALGLRKGERWPFDGRGIDSQMCDLMVIINRAHDLPYVDTRKLALAAWSVGGVTQALLQMQNDEIDAVLSLDGATGYAYGWELMKGSPWFDMGKMTVPYLHMHGEGPVRYDVPKSFAYFDSLAAADAYLLSFKKLAHGDFIAVYGSIPATLTASDHGGEVRCSLQSRLSILSEFFECLSQQ